MASKKYKILSDHVNKKKAYFNRRTNKTETVVLTKGLPDYTISQLVQDGLSISFFKDKEKNSGLSLAKVAASAQKLARTQDQAKVVKTELVITKKGSGLAAPKADQALQNEVKVLRLEKVLGEERTVALLADPTTLAKEELKLVKEALKLPKNATKDQVLANLKK